MQTKKQSLIEVMLNISTGWIVSFVLQLLVFPLYGVHFALHQNLEISAIFTFFAIIRGYLIRRLFNRATWKSFVKHMEEHK